MNKIKLALGIFITISALLSGAFYIDELNEPLSIYTCEAIGLAGPCIKLSKINADGLQTRCYFNETYKICSSGWQLYDTFEQIKEPTEIIFEVDANGELYTCESNTKKINNYTICTSSTNKEAYVGELV